MRRQIIFTLALLMSGCVGLNPGVPTRDGRASGIKPLPTRFSTHNSFIVENRFLVLPVGLQGTKVFEIPSSISVVGNADLNLEVIDLQSGEHHRVFTQPALLEGWRPSFRDHENNVLRFPGLLILEARTQDANGDGKLTWEDPLLLYGYDLTKHDLFSIVPENTLFLKCQPVNDRLILTLGAAEGKVSIYAYNPLAREGRFIVQGLLP